MASLVRLVLLLMVASLALAHHGKFHKPELIVNPFVCTPGTHYKLDCNSCICGNRVGSFGACTLQNCRLHPDECIPGNLFEINGSLCKCPDCGFKWHSDCFLGNSIPRGHLEKDYKVK